MIIDLAQAAGLVGFITEGDEENKGEDQTDQVLH